MENIPSDIRPLSAPASYRQLTPAILPLPPVSEKARRLRRRRWVIGLTIAAALHAGAILAWWLTPPLRLKASYAPERWVQVLPVPKPDSSSAPVAEKAAEPVTKPAPAAEASKQRGRKIVKPSVTPEEPH